MYKIWLLVFILLLTSNLLFAQKTVDSLRRVIATAPQDTNYVKALIRLSNYYCNRNQDSSLFFGNQVFSLPAELQKPPVQIKTYIILAFANYMKGDYKGSINTYQKMYEVAEKAGDKNNMGNAIGNQGNVYIEMGEYNTAISKFFEAKNIYELIKDDDGIARNYNNIGFVYKDRGDYEKAIANFLLALKYYEKAKAQNEVSMAYNNIAVIYGKEKNYSKAIEYSTNALEIQSKIKNEGLTAIIYNTIANVYAEMKAYQKALDNYKAASKIYEAQNDKRQIAVMSSNLGKMYELKKQFDSSKYYYQIAIDINRKIGNNRNLASSLIGAAFSQIAMNKLKEAENNLDSAEIVIKTTSKKDDLQSFLFVKSSYYETEGNDKLALNFYKKYTDLKDTIFNEENTKTIADLSIKYETEKKRLQIDLLNKDNTLKDNKIKLQRLALTQRAYDLARQQLALTTASLTISTNELQIKSQSELLLQKKIDSANAAQRLLTLNRQARIQQLEIEKQRLLNTRKNTIIVVILLVTALLCLLGYSYYRRYKLKQAAKLQAYVAEQQQMAAESILAAEENERKRIAGDLHDGLGQMMSAAKMNLSVIESEMNFDSTEQQSAFEKVIKLIDDSIKEVRTVSHTMMPNALLKAGLASAIAEFIKQIDKRVLRIQLHTEGLNERIDQNTESILYRVVQECVNNVIKHSGATQLDIALIKSDNKIEATIEDNGKGFDTKTLFSGIGLKNIQSRIQFLKGEIEWSSQPGEGTLVAFHVPITKSN